MQPLKRLVGLMDFQRQPTTYDLLFCEPFAHAIK